MANQISKSNNFNTGLAFNYNVTFFSLPLSRSTVNNSVKAFAIYAFVTCFLWRMCLEWIFIQARLFLYIYVCHSVISFVSMGTVQVRTFLVRANNKDPTVDCRCMIGDKIPTVIIRDFILKLWCNAFKQYWQTFCICVLVCDWAILMSVNIVNGNGVLELNYLLLLLLTDTSLQYSTTIERCVSNDFCRHSLDDS